MVLTVRDENVTGSILHKIEIELPSEKVTVKDIITSRVEQEVSSYNQKKDQLFKGLVTPDDAEKELNGYKSKKKKPIDPEKQVYIALDAFQKNGFFLLIDDLQVESLNQEIELSIDTQISFVKLTPLVGG